jgi:class 3 adenylate cyclase
MTATRRLAAIFAADVAGYSRLMGADEEGTHERLKAHRRELCQWVIHGTAGFDPSGICRSAREIGSFVFPQSLSRDRGFESISLQRGVQCEPGVSATGSMCGDNSSLEGPRVRIRLPPPASLLRTCADAPASTAFFKDQRELPRRAWSIRTALPRVFARDALGGGARSVRPPDIRLRCPCWCSPLTAMSRRCL